MGSDQRITKLIQSIGEITQTAGEQETTKIIPNCEIIDSNPADLIGYIIVKNELGYYIPAVKSPDITYQDGDFVNLLIIKGTEPIAFQHGSGSGTGGYPGALPLTTKGDIVTRDATDNIRLGVSTNDKVLMARSTETSGLFWEYPYKFGTPDGSPAISWEVNNSGNIVSTGGGILSAIYLSALQLCQGRLTLSTGVPVTTSAVTAATTIYFSPFHGNLIGLYDGTIWRVYTFTERSLSLSGFTADKNSDVFIYDNAGTLTLERTEWTNDSTRATALTTQDGVLVKSGAATRRYLGTFRTTASTGQCEDSLTKRYCWNYYNRVIKHMIVFNGSGHTYDSTWRAFNNDQPNSDVEFVIGVVEESIKTNLGASLTFTAGGSSAQIGPGLNSLTAVLSQATFGIAGTLRMDWVAADAFPALGYNYLVILEQGGNTGADPTFNNALIWGETRC